MANQVLTERIVDVLQCRLSFFEDVDFENSVRGHVKVECFWRGIISAMCHPIVESWCENLIAELQKTQETECIQMELNTRSSWMQVTKPCPVQLQPNINMRSMFNYFK